MRIELLTLLLISISMERMSEGDSQLRKYYEQYIPNTMTITEDFEEDDKNDDEYPIAIPKLKHNEIKDINWVFEQDKDKQYLNILTDDLNCSSQFCAHRSGELFYLSPDDSLTSINGFSQHKFDLTIQQITTLSPMKFPDHPKLLFSGSISMNHYGVSNEPSCPTNALSLNQDTIEEVLTRKDYMLTILDIITGDILFNTTISEMVDLHYSYPNEFIPIHQEEEVTTNQGNLLDKFGEIHWQSMNLINILIALFCMVIIYGIWGTCKQNIKKTNSNNILSKSVQEVESLSINQDNYLDMGEENLAYKVISQEESITQNDKEMSLSQSQAPVFLKSDIIQPIHSDHITHSQNIHQPIQRYQKQILQNNQFQIEDDGDTIKEQYVQNKIVIYESNDEVKKYFQDRINNSTNEPNKDHKGVKIISKYDVETNQHEVKVEAIPTSPQKVDFSHYKSIQKSVISQYIENGRLDSVFDTISKIGEGGFGQVFKVRHKLDRKYYAIKMIELQVNLEQDITKHKVFREIATISGLYDKNIVRYMTCWLECKDLQISQDLFQGLSTEISIKQSSQKALPAPSLESSIFDQQSCGDLQSRNNDDSEDIFDRNSELSQEESEQSQSEETSQSKQRIWKLTNQKELKNSGRIQLMIQMELCSGQTLQHYTETHPIDRKTYFKMFKQMVNAVKYIHKNNIIHRDIKPLNVFISKNNYIKLGDFGLSRGILNNPQVDGNLGNCHTFSNISRSSSQNSLIGTTLSQGVGTPYYLSPEQVNNSHYDEKVDIYALGLILVEFYCKFKTVSEKIFSLKKIRDTEQLPKEFVVKYPIESQLAFYLLRKDPKLRYSALQILSSEQFKAWKLDPLLQ